MCVYLLNPDRSLVASRVISRPDAPGWIRLTVYLRKIIAINAVPMQRFSIIWNVLIPEFSEIISLFCFSCCGWHVARDVITVM